MVISRRIRVDWTYFFVYSMVRVSNSMPGRGGNLIPFNSICTWMSKDLFLESAIRLGRLYNY